MWCGGPPLLATTPPTSQAVVLLAHLELHLEEEGGEWERLRDNRDLDTMVGSRFHGVNSQPTL